MAFNPGALNPNIPSQLASLTAGQLANILSDFSGKAVAVQQMAEAQYLSNASNLAGGSPVKFHVFTTDASSPWGAGLNSVNDTYGRRKVKYAFPYKDGQTSDDLGRKAAEYEFDALIHGPNYLAGVAALFAEFNQPTPGILTHPIFGDVEVIVDEFAVVHSSQTRFAAQLRIKFVENSFTLADAFDISANNNKSFSTAMSAILDDFNKLQNLANAVSANLSAVSTIRQKILTGVDSFTSYFAQVGGQINSAFNPNPSSVPALFPVNQGGLQTSTGTVQNPAITSTLSPQDPTASIPVSQLSAAAQAAIAEQTTQKSLQTLWAQGAALINSLEGTPNGALVFHDNILDLKNSLLHMKQALQTGLSSSTFRIFQFTTPRDMSAREVCFINGISLDNVHEIAVLNPTLDSTNQILKGTVLTVAV